MYLYTLIRFSQALFLPAGESQPLSACPHVRQALVRYLCGPCRSCYSVSMSFVPERGELCTGPSVSPGESCNTSANADPLCCNDSMLEYGGLVFQELQALPCRSDFQSINPHHALLLEVSFPPRYRGSAFPFTELHGFPVDALLQPVNAPKMAVDPSDISTTPSCFVSYSNYWKWTLLNFCVWWNTPETGRGDPWKSIIFSPKKVSKKMTVNTSAKRTL